MFINVKTGKPTKSKLSKLKVVQVVDGEEDMIIGKGLLDLSLYGEGTFETFRIDLKEPSQAGDLVKGASLVVKIKGEMVEQFDRWTKLKFNTSFHII